MATDSTNTPGTGNNTDNNSTNNYMGTYNSSRSNTVDNHNIGNIAVVNTGTNPVINFSFMIRVEGVFDLPCRSVKGFTKENEFDYIQEGGVNDYVHMRRKPISKPFTLQVERYVGVDYVDPLPLGAELVLPMILFVNKYCFPTFKPVATYTFTGCTVISKTTGELNAEASGLFVETTTIAYREMVAVKIPSQAYDLDENTWSFLDGGTYKGKVGNGKFHRLESASNKEYSSTNLVGEKGKTAMSALANKNVFSINKAGRYSESKENHKTYTRTAGSKVSKSAAIEKAKNNVYAINTGEGGRYSKSTQRHVINEPTAASARRKPAMIAKSVLWDPSKDVTLGVITPERRSSGGINGSANHSRELRDKNELIQLADLNKFDINKKPSSDNGKAKRNGPSAKEPSRDSMIRRARKHKYSFKDKTNKSAQLNELHSSARELSLSDMNAKAEQNKFPTVRRAKTKEMVTPEPKLWPAKSSATTKPMKPSEIRIWPEKSSATTKPMKPSENRIWPEKASATTKPMKPSEKRVWPEKPSATTKPMKPSDKRTWPDDKSAITKPMKPSGKRTWPGQKSATTKPMKPSDKRAWPDQASATTKPMTPSDKRAWPGETSAVTKPMKNTTARLWPQVRSAQSVTDFLKK